MKKIIYALSVATLCIFSNSSYAQDFVESGMETNDPHRGLVEYNVDSVDANSGSGDNNSGEFTIDSVGSNVVSGDDSGEGNSGPSEFSGDYSGDYSADSSGEYSGESGSGLGSGEYSDCNACETWCEADGYCLPCFNLDLRVGVFFPFSKRLRERDENVWQSYDFEVGYNLSCNWQAWVGVGYISSTGHSNLGAHSCVSYIPTTFGLKYFMTFWDCITAYWGLGAIYSNSYTTNDSPFVPKHVRKGSFGAIAKSGVVYEFCNGFEVEFCVDYLSQRIEFKDVEFNGNFIERQDLDLSGVRVGLGLGYGF